MVVSRQESQGLQQTSGERERRIVASVRSTVREEPSTIAAQLDAASQGWRENEEPCELRRELLSILMSLEQ